MTIQISVTVWAVICFILLCVILNNLLFKPVLKVMDDRKEKIENAKRKALELEEKFKEEQRIAEERFKEQESLNREKIKAQAEELRTSGKKKLEEAKKERLSAVEEYKVSTEKELQDDYGKASGSVEKIAEEFLSNLFAG